MGTACRTFLKRPDGAAPTFCDGESALTNSGKRFSIALKRWRSASYSASVTVGASFLVVAFVMPLDLEREPHVLDLGLRLGEVGDVGKRFGFCCSGHGAWIRRSGREGKGGYSFVPRT
ncbi:hypothetical protein ACVW0I_006329 [Bradyrhizobium sp. LM6.11]